MLHASGKLILFGEHAAVYGELAVATQISLGVTAKILNKNSDDDFIKNIIKIFEEKTDGAVSPGISFIIDSELPMGSGLGSSAAVAYACFQALAAKYGLDLLKDKYIELVSESEKCMHGNPSGIDSYAVVQGGLFSFVKKDNKPQIVQIRAKRKYKALLVNSGTPQETTKDMINVVASNINARPSLKKIIEKIGDISKRASKQLTTDELDLSLVRQNQRLLEAIGVVSPEGKQIIRQVESFGGVGKVTGAGGKTNGSGMILALHEDDRKLQELYKLYKKNSYQITFPLE